ncbi:GspH/FimT family pseudopilin [Pseudomonas asuensis]|uniref:Type II secretion system protein H n=1 Tax=Pseudomonas asuensis TaxID=1825787 RepID=A0ABQ2GHL8_9PSED|nr:GspH/FimT family pseudopilin [Pseudomonas asuensis]GGL96606.1 hypothetical protein GCM10009425_04500 [Pseudomonas asuensis]
MRSARGFTLIELMVTVAVLAIVLTIAVPSFNNLIQSSRARALVSELNGALQIARSEALKRRKNVIVCPRNDTGTDCDSGADWSSGWLVRQVSGDIIRIWEKQTNDNIKGPGEGIMFLPNGASTAESTISVTPDNCDAESTSSLKVSKMGSIIICPKSKT